MAIYKFQKDIEPGEKYSDIPTQGGYTYVYYAVPESEFWRAFGLISRLRYSLMYYSVLAFIVTIQLSLLAGVFMGVAAFMYTLLTTGIISVAILILYHNKKLKSTLYTGYIKEEAERLLDELVKSRKACFAFSGRTDISSKNGYEQIDMDCWHAFEEAFKQVSVRYGFESDELEGYLRDLLVHGSSDKALKVLLDSYVIRALELELSYEDAFKEACYVAERAVPIVILRVYSMSDI